MHHKKIASYIVKMILAQVGTEQGLHKNLAKKDHNTLSFKVLGDYDILVFSKLSKIHDASEVCTEPHILGIKTFPCFYWESNDQQFWNDILSSPAPSILFLKINEIILDQLGVDGLFKILNFLGRDIKIGRSKHRVYPLSGLGYYEIILWYPADNFVTIFSLLRKLRHWRISTIFPDFDKNYKDEGLFTDTNTLPLISYDKVISTKKWNLLKGNIKPITKIKCAPINEIYVANSFGVGADVKDILGNDDLVFIWNKPIPLWKFVEHLVNFRKKWEEHPILRDTSTELLSFRDIPTSFKEVPLERAEEQGYISENLHELASISGINHYVINEITHIVSMMNIHRSHCISPSIFSDVIHSAMTSLNLFLEEYIRCLKHEQLEDKIEVEMEILEFTTCTRMALSQRFPGVEISESDFSFLSATTYLV